MRSLTMDKGCLYRQSAQKSVDRTIGASLWNFGSRPRLPELLSWTDQVQKETRHHEPERTKRYGVTRNNFRLAGGDQLYHEFSTVQDVGAYSWIQHSPGLKFLVGYFYFICSAQDTIPSSRGLAVLIMKKPAALDAAEAERVEQLRKADVTLATAISLVQEFAVIVRERQPSRLDDWLERAAQSGIAPLAGFVNGVRRDYPAVKAGITLTYSNGPTEGHINRLKMLKRQMFGRAKLDLLEKRVMAAN